MAMEMLKARLYEAELQRREAVSAAQEDAKTEIGWGHQIRNYVLAPYQLVKDLRTGVEKGNPAAVLDGDLDAFMAAALAARSGATRSEASAQAPIEVRSATPIDIGARDMVCFAKRFGLAPVAVAAEVVHDGASITGSFVSAAARSKPARAGV